MGASTNTTSSIKKWILGHLAGIILWLLKKTLHYKITTKVPLPEQEGPYLFAIFHEHQLQCVMFSPFKKLVTMASLSKDGSIIAHALSFFNIVPARGSSSRAGKQALQSLVNHVLQGYSCAITVDGPRGPRHEPKYGIFSLAQKTKRPIVPAVALASRAYCLSSWDQFKIAKPFSHGLLLFGTPIYIEETADYKTCAKQLKQALYQLEKEAQCVLKHTQKNTNND